MVRLAIVDKELERVQALTLRLRRATIHPHTADADAVAFLDSAFATEIERELKASRTVLVTADANVNSERLRTWTELARQGNARLSIVNPDRYLPSRQLIRQQLDAGKLGEAGLIRLHRWGAVGNLLCDLDIVHWLFARPANLVYALENETCIQIHLGFPGGGMALLGNTTRLPAGDTYCHLSVVGSSGSACADDHQNMQVVFQGGPARAVRTQEGVLQWSALLQDFVDHVEAETSRVESPWDSVLKASDAVAQSLRTKQAVSV